MDLHFVADWLNSAFSGYDQAILSFLHSLALAAGWLLTPIARAVTLIGEKGIIMFLAAFILMLFPKTRKSGICVFGAVCCGALITNIILKDAVARTRPFETTELFRQWWEAVGAPMEDEFSFPSGHVTSIMAGMCALCFTRGKKNILPTAGAVFLMGFSRNYLMAHYPSDVLGAMCSGLFAAAASFLVTVLIYYVVEKYSDKAFFKFILDFDVRDLFKKKESRDV